MKMNQFSTSKLLKTQIYHNLKELIKHKCWEIFI